MASIVDYEYIAEEIVFVRVTWLQGMSTYSAGHISFAIQTGSTNNDIASRTAEVFLASARYS